MSSRRLLATTATSLITLLAAVGVALPVGSPIQEAETGALPSVVYIEAKGCLDGSSRGGTGFVFERAGQIVTAHHVVGGCSQITVLYPEGTVAGSRLFNASIGHIYPAGDLAALTVPNAPPTPVLQPAAPPPDRSSTYAGLGYQNSEISADGLPVTFSPNPETRLDHWLPVEAQQELTQSGSLIDTSRAVLRFNAHLEPGMSGGPIIDQHGKVVGIVAGGLRAGTVPASWGWPSEWLTDLMRSNSGNAEVKVARTFYTLADLKRIRSSAQTKITCGDLEFTYHGRRRYRDIAASSDDQQRLALINRASRPEDLDQLEFDVWVHQPSGATALMPAGYPLTSQDGVCVVDGGTLHQVLWAKNARFDQLQQISNMFETGVMLPRVAAYQFGWQWDPILTKFPMDNFGIQNFAAGPQTQTRSDGLVFLRKGFIHNRSTDPNGPHANSFETLASRNNTFMGAGTINDFVAPEMGQCSMINWNAPTCGQVYQDFKKWTHFILSTQLST
jgi:hypothetical protein